MSWLPHHFENIGVRRQRRIARRLKDAILQLGKGVVRDQRREMRHGERTVEFVKIGLGQIEKSRSRFEKIVRAIGFHFQAHGVAAARAPQFLLDAAQEVFRFFLVDVEIAVARDAKGVHAIEDEAGKKIGRCAV